jgi:hypothetical protein
MPLLSDIARRKKIDFFLRPIARDTRILESGCGSRWVGEFLTGCVALPSARPGLGNNTPQRPALGAP